MAHAAHGENGRHRITPPGPSGDRFIGNIRAYEQNRLGFLLECARTYGDVVRFSDHVSIVNAPQLVEEITTRTYREFEPPINLLRQSVGAASQVEWRRHRQEAASALGRTAVHAFLPEILGETIRTVSGWREGGAPDLLRDMEAITSRSIARFCFGSDGDDIPVRAAAMLDALFPIVASPFVAPSWLPTPAKLRLRWALRDLDRRILAIIAARKRSDPRRDALQALLPVYSGTQGQLSYLFISMLLAAHTVPAAALAWTFHLLACSPETQVRLRAEVSELRPNWESRGRELDELPLLDAVVRESLRLYPPTWLAARRVVTPVCLGDYQFGRGHTLLYSSFVIHRDRTCYERPTSFVPDRWLDVSWREALPRYAYFPFGGGPRMCPGTTFALAEVKAIVATVIGRFELQAGERKPIVDARRTLLPRALELTVRATADSPELAGHPAADYSAAIAGPG